MMHAISSRYFGDRLGAIAVHFHDGVAITSGYIVGQIGASKYIVSDGRIESIVTLATEEAHARLLLGELEIGGVYPLALIKQRAVIIARNSSDVAWIKRLSTSEAITLDGAVIGWSLDASGDYQIETIGYVAANEADGSLDFDVNGNSGLLCIV